MKKNFILQKENADKTFIYRDIFEYRIVNIEFFIEMTEKMEIKSGTIPERCFLGLNELGKDGWELVSVVEKNNGWEDDFYFKRKIESI